MQTTTARTKRFLEAQGCRVGLVERYNAHIRRRFDLFGDPKKGLVGIDQIALGYPGFPILFIQSCSNNGGRHAEHREGMIRNPAIREILEAGAGVGIISWAKKKGRWSARIEILTLDDLDVD